MSSQENRSRLDIVKEIHQLTSKMKEQKKDADFLVQSIEQRQKLMDEYDRLQRTLPPLSADEMRQARKYVDDAARMDQEIGPALLGHRDLAKKDLADSNSQQKVLGYVNQAMSSSGSYMDYKK